MPDWLEALLIEKFVVPNKLTEDQLQLLEQITLIGAEPQPVQEQRWYISFPYVQADILKWYLQAHHIKYQAIEVAKNVVQIWYNAPKNKKESKALDAFINLLTKTF